jgi:serine/threonine protein kinase
MSKQITGTVIDGRYKVTGYLRDGRMGNVYVGRRLEDQAMVAIKMLDPSLFEQEEAIRRFEREVRVQSRISHPNSTAVFDAGKTDDGLPWLAMEYFDGELLSEFIEDHERIPIDVAVRVAGQIAMALEAAHEIGIIHRDLSPENIMLLEPESDEPTVKVLDFGLAGVLDATADEDTSLTAVGIRVGTPFYMAPEYIEDFECDHRADLYALGIVLFEMITGKPPFVGRPYRVMDMHVNEPAPVLSTLVADTPPWLDKLLAGLLAKEPKDRPPTARAIVAAIEKGAGVSLQRDEDLSPQEAPSEQAEPEHTMIGRSVADPVLERLRAKLVVSVDRRTGDAPSPRDCLVVERVSRYSVFADYGMQPGTLVHIEELDEGLLDPTLIKKPNDTLTYVFHVNGERVRLKTKAALLGVNFARSVENIRTYYNPATDGDEPLFELWRQGAWEVLERLATRVMSAGNSLGQGLFSRIMGSSRPKPVNHPATLFYGACLVETGRGEEGFPYCLEYKKNHANNWPEVYLAIATAYAGLHRLQAGKRDLGLQLLEESYKLEPLKKVRRALEKTKGTAPDGRQLYKRPFPRYRLDQPDGRTGADLETTTAAMDDSQILLIVLLGGFRGNPRYNAFLMRFLNYAAYFSDFVVGCHVATTVKDRTSDHRPDWFTGEDLAVAANLPFVVLEDYRAFVQREAKPVRIPTVYAVNRDGIVLHEGLGTPADLWNALGRAGQLRMHKLQGGSHG